MPVAVTSLYHSSLNHLTGLTHSFLTEGLTSYFTEIIVTISHKSHLLYYPHLPQFSFFPLTWRMPCLSSKDNTFISFFSPFFSFFLLCLYILVKHYLISTFDIVFFLWILMNSRRECSLFSWPHFLLLLLSPPEPLHSPRFLLILQLLPSFLILPICPWTFFLHPYFQLLSMY